MAQYALLFWVGLLLSVGAAYLLRRLHALQAASERAWQEVAALLEERHEILSALQTVLSREEAGPRLNALREEARTATSRRDRIEAEQKIGLTVGALWDAARGSSQDALAGVRASWEETESGLAAAREAYNARATDYNLYRGQWFGAALLARALHPDPLPLFQPILFRAEAPTPHD